jgi:hypothetical protein
MSSSSPFFSPASHSAGDQLLHLNPIVYTEDLLHSTNPYPTQRAYYALVNPPSNRTTEGGYMPTNTSQYLVSAKSILCTRHVSKPWEILRMDESSSEDKC